MSIDTTSAGRAAAAESTAPLVAAGKRAFEYLPVGLFGAVMGLTGLSVAWRIAYTRYAAPVWVADSVGTLAVVAFIAIAAAYVAKAVTAPDAVAAEFRHPIAGNLFGTVFISLLLLPIVLAPLALQLARAMWCVGAVGMSAFAWLIVSRWMSERQQPAHATPAWIVPVVGMLDVPLAVPSLAVPSLHPAMVFALAVGLFFALPLFTLVFSRLLFEAPMPDALRPSLLILVAPFAVGFSAYVTTTGRMDLFAEALFALTLFILAVLVGRMRELRVCCPFRVAWWAASFPLSASAIAALRHAVAEPGALADTIALALLALATATAFGLLVRTLLGLLRGELRTLSS